MEFKMHHQFQEIASGSLKKFRQHFQVCRALLLIFVYDSYIGDCLYFGDQCRIKHLPSQQYLAVVPGQEKKPLVSDILYQPVLYIGLLRLP